MVEQKPRIKFNLQILKEIKEKKIAQKCNVTTAEPTRTTRTTTEKALHYSKQVNNQISGKEENSILRIFTEFEEISETKARN